MENSEIILTNLRIPAKGSMQYYANYTIGNISKEDVLRHEPMKNRQVDINCPPSIDLFTHMKICLVGYLFENTEEYNLLMNRVLKSPEERIQFGNFFMADIGNFTAVVDNIKKIIYLEKL